MNFGEKFKTHCYKHDGAIHKCWEENFYLGSTEEYNIFTNYRTKVVEFDGRVWYTKEPAIIFFSKKNISHPPCESFVIPNEIRRIFRWHLIK